MKNILKRFARWLLKDELKVLHTALIQQTQSVEIKQEVRVVVPRERFDSIVDKLPRQIVGTTSTQLQCAALVGQQATVDHFRKELTS